MEDEKKQLRELLTSIFAGLAAGIFMATILLFVMNHFQIYSFSSLAWILLVIIGMPLPWCLDFLKDRGFSILRMELITVVVSFVITFLYVETISRNALAKQNLTNLMLVVHACSFVVTLVRTWFLERKDRQ